MSRLSRAVVFHEAVPVTAALLLVGTVACVDRATTPSGTENNSSSLKIGDQAPDFTLPSADGDDVSLADYRGKKRSSCTSAWARGERRASSRVVDLQGDQAFAALDVELISIATDPVSAWEEEARKNDITLPLASDEGAKVCNEYGVMQWQMGASRSIPSYSWTETATSLGCVTTGRPITEV
jgi:hypothetical protein